MTKGLYETRKKRLVDFYKKFKRLPTYDEFAEVFHVKSKGSIHKYVQKFIDDELVLKSDGGKLIPTTKLYGLRVLGSVQAGFPTTAEQEDVATLSLDEYLIDDPDNTYMLYVSGDSMIDAGIVEGDLVVVDRTKSPKDGDIVVARVDNDWTLKYFKENGAKMFLRAANANYPDIHPEDELYIGGVVSSVIRKYS